MKIGTALLKQLERCGLAAKIAEEHFEISDGEFRDTRIEIGRAFHANDATQITEADAALRWLVTEPGTIVSVCEPLDLIDDSTGEVLVSGKPGAVVEGPDAVLVVNWASADWYTDSEPEDDLGLLAMGLAASNGRPFRVATVALREHDAFPRRSPSLFTPDQHPPLLERIKAARSRPRVACPGDWCGACKQAVYCPAWKARAITALTVITEEAPLGVDPETGKPKIPTLDITNDNSGALMERAGYVETVAELVKKQIQAHVRRGGRCVVNGQELYPGQRDGRESVSASALKALTQDQASDTPEMATFKASLRLLVKTGDSYEQFGWRKFRSAAAARKR
jgi:hypothetical protein